ncbi:MAG: NADH:ubiquinone oxidoreductase [Spirochaetia bacterium]|nr:NADH:ubiquinone oxidoreductase [Spirochaetia bacterium]
MNFSGLPLKKYKAAFFDFTSCEGCQLQVLNNEKNLISFLSLIEIVNFREISSEKRDDYEIAFIEGAVSRKDQLPKLKEIREKAKMVIALGTCACYGGVNAMKNSFSIEAAVSEVYKEQKVDTMPVQKISDIIDVDLQIPGCPISKKELEEILLSLSLGSVVDRKKYPVCVECKQNMNHCFLDQGKLCFGTITRAGCNSVCVNGKLPCYGCRGPSDETNWKSLKNILQEKGITEEEIDEKLTLFNTLYEVTKK